MYKILLVAYFTVASHAGAMDAVYGGFDIKDISRSRPFIIKKQSMSVAVILNKHSLTPMFSGEFYKKKTNYLGNGMPICREDSPWESNEIVIGTCSSFLVAPNKMLTAGHCVLNRQWDCDQKVFLFDASSNFTTNSASQYFTKSQVYSCKKILGHVNEGEGGVDYALIELDREVVGRTPIDINTSSNFFDDLYMIGHPLGLTQKIATAGLVRTIDELNITAEIDSFSGNSGSPVFSGGSNKVMGMLVSGEDDFRWNDEKECFNHVYCKSGECKGESIIRSDVLFELIKDDL